MDEAADVNNWISNLDLESVRYRDLAFKLEKQDRSCNKSKIVLFSAGLVGSGVTLAGIFIPDSQGLVTTGLGLSSTAIGFVAASNIADTVVRRKLIKDTGLMIQKDKSAVLKASLHISNTGENPVLEEKVKTILKIIDRLEELIKKENRSLLLRVGFSIKVYFDKLMDMYNIFFKGSDSIAVVDEDVIGVIGSEVQKQGGMTVLYGLYLYVKTSLALVRSSSRSSVKVSGVVVLSLFVVYLSQLISSLRAMNKSPPLVTAMRTMADTMAQQTE